MKNYLFDLDGLLIDSETLYFNANKIYFAQFGFEFTVELHKECTGKKFEEWIKTAINIDIDGPTMLEGRNKIYFKLAESQLRLMDGAKDLLAYAKAQGKTALVTSSNNDYVDFVFKRTGIGSYFDLVITGDQVTKGKPDPEGYMKAASYFGVDPKNCIVFEDSPNGVLAGKNAGMRVVAVPSVYVACDTIFENADLVLKSLGDYVKNEHKI